MCLYCFVRSMIQNCYRGAACNACLQEIKACGMHMHHIEINSVDRIVQFITSHPLRTMVVLNTSHMWNVYVYLLEMNPYAGAYLRCSELCLSVDALTIAFDVCSIHVSGKGVAIPHPFIGNILNKFDMDVWMHPVVCKYLESVPGALFGQEVVADLERWFQEKKAWPSFSLQHTCVDLLAIKSRKELEFISLCLRYLHASYPNTFIQRTDFDNCVYMVDTSFRDEFEYLFRGEETQEVLFDTGAVCATNGKKRKQQGDEGEEVVSTPLGDVPPPCLQQLAPGSSTSKRHCVASGQEGQLKWDEERKMFMCGDGSLLTFDEIYGEKQC